MPANLPPGYVPEGATATLQGGIPWEQKGGGILSSWWATMKACNGETRPFFATAAQNEKGEAITFGMLSGAVSGAFMGLLYVMVFGMVSAGLMIGMPALGGGKTSPGGTAIAAGLTFGLGLFYAAVITVGGAMKRAVRPFLWGGLHHVLLMMLGGIGERKSFMHTVRVVAYAEGSAMPWIWIPVAGPFIAMFFGVKNLVVGYDETHRCGIGKALLVLAAPFLCCCGCGVMVMLLGMVPAFLKP